MVSCVCMCVCVCVCVFKDAGRFLHIPLCTWTFENKLKIYLLVLDSPEYVWYVWRYWQGSATPAHWTPTLAGLWGTLSPCWPITGTFWSYSRSSYRLIGLVVRRLRKVPGSNPACGGIFSGSSHTSDLNIGTPVATLPGVWHYRVSAGTGRPGVSILWLGEMESLICNFYLSVAAHEIVWADLSLRYTSLLLGR